MPKRGENIRKRKDGRWEARILTDTGKYKSVYAQSYYEVKEKSKQSRDITSNKHYKCNVTFEYVCQQWIKDNSFKNKQSTTAIYIHICNKHIIPYFGKMKPENINSNHINTFIRYKTYRAI